jgi:hypothetical protein
MIFPTASGYTKEQLTACESVILELSRILGRYWEYIFIVGGYVPTLIANDPSDPHRGTMDVDLALNHLEIPEEAYAKIHELLIGHGYRHNTDKAKQFQYFRDISLGAESYTVVVDLLTGQYNVDSGKKRRHEPVQDVMALKARGLDLVYTRYQEVVITGDLPNRGGKHSATCRVAGVVPLTVMKAVCIDDRYKSKDSYDVYYTIKHYPGGIAAVMVALKPDLNHGLIKESVQLLRKTFASPDSSGPADIANFLEVDEEADRAVLMRDAYETFKALFDTIDKLAE